MRNLNWMNCYEITYRDQHGTHTATKWGNSPGEAIDMLRKAHRRRRKPIIYETPRLVEPQPFSEEARAAGIAKATPDEKGPVVELFAPDPDDLINDGPGVDRGDE